ncbi:MAG: N-acetylneuraminate synthase family protein [Candidatus Omnitrophota bacterium]
MSNISLRPLFIFEMANNHMGKLEHGLRIVREIYEVSKKFPFNFAFKLQYRDLDTFIHPDFKGRHEYKHIKRFSQTRLKEEEFLRLKEEIDKCGFVSICTPFDEQSVGLIEKQDWDIIKLGSCSFTDWPLLERIVKTDKPIIASVAGATVDDIDRVVSFFLHRDKKLSLLHCVSEYPTLKENLQLNQIDFLKRRYPGMEIGYSNHETGSSVESVKLAISKGATIFEKHVGVKDGPDSLNAYSAMPQEIFGWLSAAQEALTFCGLYGERYKFSEKELNDLRALKRGAFVSESIKAGDKIDPAKLFFAIPIADGQISASEVSKYTEFYAKINIGNKQAVFFKDVKIVELREKVYKIVSQAKEIIRKSGVVVPNQLGLEISYHYGIDDFERYGGVIINCINREYCKKIIVLMPGQAHPEQYHKEKEETFNVLYGDIEIKLDGKDKVCHPGDVVVVERGVRHSFSTKGGTVIEEISSTHYKDDSYYTDPKISENKNRKTLLTDWLD